MCLILVAYIMDFRNYIVIISVPSLFFLFTIIHSSDFSALIDVLILALTDHR